MALTAGALKSKRDGVPTSIVENYMCLQREHQAIVKQMNELTIKFSTMRGEYDMVLKQLKDAKKANEDLRKQNVALMQDNESLRRASGSWLTSQHNKAVEDNIIVALTVEESTSQIAKSEAKRNRKPSKQPQARVYDANNEEDVEYIFGKCCGEGVSKCMLSDAFVNKHYKTIIQNNGFHNGMKNACLAISLSDGLSRIIHGRPANSQEKDEMIKVLGCKGRMMDMSDLNVLVAIFNKVCAPHAINIHVFERKANGYHAHHQSIAHSPKASARDRCIVLSWIADTHFELMVRS
jgi:hypothetical protein